MKSSVTDPAVNRRRFRPDAPKPTREVALGRAAAFGWGISFAALLAWSAGSAWYLLAQDGLARRGAAREAALVQTYEERIGALLNQIDRSESRKLLEENTLEARVTHLLTRQAQFEARQAAIMGLVDQSGIGPSTLRGAGTSPQAGSSLPDGATAFAPPLPAKPTPEESPFQLRLRSGDAAPSWRSGALDKGPLPARVAAAEKILEAGEARQLGQLDRLTSSFEQQATRLRVAIRQIGLDPDALRGNDGGTSAMGGPLVELPADNGSFRGVIGRLQESYTDFDRLRKAVRLLPLGRPVAGEVDLSSGFGMRLDPFTRAPAMHTGLDFRGEHGTPVRATGSGKVISAEYTGGYGNMVEIDHGNGVTSRYAHLSAIAVVPGQRIDLGAIVGRIGSTGRSTGPHLHYETRIDGDAVSPYRFLRAGAGLFEVAESR